MVFLSVSIVCIILYRGVRLLVQQRRTLVRSCDELFVLAPFLDSSIHDSQRHSSFVFLGLLCLGSESRDLSVPPPLMSKMWAPSFYAQ